MLAFFLPITVVLVAFTLLPLWRHEAWWVRALDFPRLQLFTMSLALILMLLSGDLSSPSTWGMLIAALACCIFQGWWILPYTRLFPVEVAPADPFTLGEIRRMRGFGSDHFALLTELLLTKAHNADQAGLEADAEDQRWADDKADAQGVDKADVPESGGRQAPLAPTGR